MATGDKFHVTTVAALDRVAIANIFYVDVLDDSGGPGDVEELHDQFTTHIIGKLKALQSSKVEYECNLIRKVAPTSDPAYMYPLTDVGALGTSSLPSNLTMCCNTWSNLGRPPERGRWFFSGMLESAIDHGRWTKASAGSWDPFLAQIGTSFGPSGSSYRLMHWSESQEEFFPMTRGRLAAVPRKLRNRTPGLCSIS